jgi:hypothetical protein
LVEKISIAQLIVGCVAWFTHTEIIAALAKKEVSIIVQKEDWLRPDFDEGVEEKKRYAVRLRESYRKLRCGPDRWDYGFLPVGGHLGSMSTNGDTSIAPVRCCGISRRGDYYGRMHHKFLVFCWRVTYKYVYCNQDREIEEEAYASSADELEEFESQWENGDECIQEEVATAETDYYRIKPYAVWTGSFNFTRNSENSFENAVYIEDSGIAFSYMQEWAQIAAISEPLDWTSEWVQPEWRIGT